MKMRTLCLLFEWEKKRLSNTESLSHSHNSVQLSNLTLQTHFAFFLCECVYVTISLHSRSFWSWPFFWQMRFHLGHKRKIAENIIKDIRQIY